jgi:Putative transposase/Transposase zinc-binding domain
MATIQEIFQDNYLKYAEEKDIPEYVREAGYKIMVCGTSELGAHIHKCKDCGEEIITYNPCHHRSCPKCSWTARQEWLNKQLEKMLNCKYYHIVFTIPHELNKYYLNNKRVFMGMFFEAVKETIFGMMCNPKFLGAEPGVIATGQTWSSTLIDHVHIHVLVTAGGITDKWEWKESKNGYLFPVGENGAMGVFRAKMLEKFKNGIKRGKIGLFKGSCRNKAFREINELYKKEWHIYAEEQYKYGHGVLKYLANYIKGGPIGNSRIKRYDGKTVVFSYKNSKNERKEEEMELSVEEFMRRLLQHVPEKGMQMTRYWGLFSTPRKEELEAMKELLGGIEERVEINEIKCSKCRGNLEYIGEIAGKRVIRISLNILRKKRLEKLRVAI